MWTNFYTFCDSHSHTPEKLLGKAHVHHLLSVPENMDMVCKKNWQTREGREFTLCGHYSYLRFSDKKREVL